MAGRLYRLRPIDVLIAVPDFCQLIVDRLLLDLSRLRQVLSVPLAQILVVLHSILFRFLQELLALFMAHGFECIQLLFAEQIVHLVESFGELGLLAERDFFRTGHFLLRLWFLRRLHECLARILVTDLIELLVEVCDLGLGLLNVLLAKLHVDAAAIVRAHSLVDNSAELLAVLECVPFLLRSEVVFHPLAAAPEVIRARGIVGEDFLEDRTCLRQVLQRLGRQPVAILIVAAKVRPLILLVHNGA